MSYLPSTIRPKFLASKIHSSVRADAVIRFALEDEQTTLRVWATSVGGCSKSRQL